MALFESSIAALGLLIVVGLASRYFLKKTGFSDVFLLLLFGIAAGAALPDSLIGHLSVFAAPFAAIAILMIILEEGLNLSFERLRRHLHKALLFGAVSFSLSFILLFSISYFVAGLPPLFSLLVAAIFASVAPEALASFLHALSASKETIALGELESIFSDALSVILTILLVSAYTHGGGDLSSVPVQIILSLLLSIALGALCAAFWRRLFSKSEEENRHLLIIGIAALLYSASSLAGADGVVSVFTFALFMGNFSSPVISEMRRFQGEITFFLRTFLLLYLGMLLFHSQKPLDVFMLAAALSVAAALARHFSGKLAGFLESSAKESRLLELVSCRGLSSAALCVFAQSELSSSGITPQVDLPVLGLAVIFFTSLLSAILVLKKRTPRRPTQKTSIESLVRGGLDSL